MKADGNGFLIADKPLSVENLTSGIEGVRSDTSAILALLKMGARSDMQDRARVRSASNGRNDAPGRADAGGGACSDVASNPNASRQPSPADPAAPPRAKVERARDARGRFTAAPKSELTQVAKAVNSLTRRQAAVVAAQQAEAAQQETQKPASQTAQRASQPSERDARGRFVGGAKAGGASGGGDGNADDAGDDGESEVRRKSKREREAGDGILSRFKGLLAGIKTPGAGVGDFDKVDPAVEASKELGRIVSGPLNAVGSVGKAVIGSRFGRAKDASVSWLQRIFGELRTARTQSDTAANAQPPDANLTTDGGASAEPALAPASDGPTPVSAAPATGSSTPPPVPLPTAAIGLPGIHAPSRAATARSKGAGRAGKSVASPVASTTPGVSPSPLPNTSVGRAVIGRGFGGGKDGSPSWLRRIVRELRLSRAQAGEFALAEARVLHDIERKTGGGGFSPERAGVLGGIAGGVGGLLGKGGGFLGALLGGGLKLGKGALKRLPLLGALFAGGSALASAFGGDDPNKSAEQNRHDRYTGVGSGVGAIVGGALGSLLGPVGTLVGGVIGDKVGELVGDWLSTIDWGKVGDTITGAWDGAVTTVKDTWTKVTDSLSTVVKTVSEAWTGIITGAKAFVKDKFGIDIDAAVEKTKAAIQPAVDFAKEKAKPVVEAVSAGVDVAKQGASAAVDYGKERVEKMAAPYKAAADNTIDWGKGLVGGGSKGNKAAIMRQAASIADPNERAMFLAQMDHESGGFRSMEEDPRYKAKNFLKNFGKRNGITTEAQAQAILDKGQSATFEAMYGGAWGKKNLGNTQAGDAEMFKGRGFTQLTGRANYTAAAKATGLDLVNHPELAADPNNAAKVAMWYWNSKSGLSDAAKTGDVTAATYKINGGYNGLDERAAKFKAYKAMSPTVTAAAPAPVLPSPVITAAAPAVPPAPPVPPTPAPPPPAPPPTVAANIPQQLNSDGPLEVRVAKETAVGQDLADRRLAQIATGGISTS
ncbi:hypothetical protein PQR05_29500 [Paraburkholderia sediminicola]|uniref:glycoside hydrolase family 19 protein n=1 Tax=Paraburkholderia sediminicola TaxID=458836 RepID=UPI0038B8C14E